MIASFPKGFRLPQGQGESFPCATALIRGTPLICLHPLISRSNGHIHATDGLPFVSVYICYDTHYCIQPPFDSSDLGRREEYEETRVLHYPDFPERTRLAKHSTSDNIAFRFISILHKPKEPKA